jgi:hypothetical protein
MGTSQSEDEGISTSAELSPEAAQLSAGLKTFRMLLAEFSGKSLYNCIRWVKHQPYLSAVPKENKVCHLFYKPQFQNEMLDCHARGLLGSIYDARDNRVADSDD